MKTWAGRGAAHLPPTPPNLLLSTSFLPPFRLPLLSPPPHQFLCLKRLHSSLSLPLGHLSNSEVSQVSGNPCLCFLHLSVSLCLHLSDFDFHLDPYIPASLCLSLPSEACASVSRLSCLFWSLSFPERLSLPSRRIDLPRLRRWLRGAQSLGPRAWATGWGLGSRRRRGGDTPSSDPRETRVPVTCLPDSGLLADAPDVGATGRILSLPDAEAN